LITNPLHPVSPQTTAKMSMFRAKKLDLGCFTNIKIIRDHSKRKAFEAHEAERYRPSFFRDSRSKRR
jgi:hypothetical protein